MDNTKRTRQGNYYKIADKYIFSIFPEEWEQIKTQYEADLPTEIGIDTETDSLDPAYGQPYQIVIGWETSTGIYKHWIVEVDRDDTVDVENTTNLMKWTVDLGVLQVFHNAKFDISVISNMVGKWYRPKFFCTLLAAAHATKFMTLGLKPLATMLKLRSKFDHIEGLWNQITAAAHPHEKAALLQQAVDNGWIPESDAVKSHIEDVKLALPEGLEYFQTLFEKPDELVEKLKEKHHNEYNEKWKLFAGENGLYDISLYEAYDYITNVYSYGPKYEKIREVLRDFNQKAFGGSNEWVRLYSAGKRSVLNVVSYRELNKMDQAALTMYAGMDVKLTLSLYKYLIEEMRKNQWTEEQWKVLQIDFDVTYAVMMQEKVGFALDVNYIEESMDKARKALLTLNKAIETKFDYITGKTFWKEEYGLKKDELLQANNYSIYNQLFADYVPFLKLPVFIDNKKEVKLSSVRKALEYIKLIKQNLEGHPEADEEMYEAFLEANSSVYPAMLVGELEDGELDGNGGLFREMFTAMFDSANAIVKYEEKRVAEGRLKKDGTPALKWRSGPTKIKEALTTAKGPIELMETLYEISMTSQKITIDGVDTVIPSPKAAGNDVAKKYSIKVVPIVRTLNKTTSVPLLKVDVNALNITDEQKAIAYEAQEIVDLKKTEATLLKWIGTYMIKLLAGVGSSPDGRLRTTYNLASVVTGRLACDVHQFPKGDVRDPFNKDIVLYEPRRAFVVETLPSFEGEQAIIAYEDFSQMELRVAAEYTLRYGVPDTALLQAYVPWEMYHPVYGQFDIDAHRDIWNQDTVRYWDEEKGEWGFTYNWYSEYNNYTDDTRWEPTDLHLAPVKVAFPHMFNEDGDPLDEFKNDVKNYRNVCKALNFGGLYGQGLAGLLGNAMFADFEREILETLHKAHKETYVNLKKFQSTVMQFVRKHGHISNLFGRKYIKGFPYGSDKFGKGYQFAYRGTNYLIQGECATLLKDRMIAMEKYIHENNLKATLLQNIHDEVAIIMPISEREHIFHLRALIQDSPWKVNMVSDIEVSVTNWAEKKEVIALEDIDKIIAEKQK